MATRRGIGAAWLAAGLFLALAWLVAPGPASAQQAQPIEGTDRQDGRAVTGLRLTSERGDAFLYVYCKAGRAPPEIALSLPVELGKPRDRVDLSYRIDDGDLREAWFLIAPGGRSGNFYIRHNSIYEARFGRQPRTIDPETGLTSQAYMDWIADIHRTVTEDLVLSGAVAEFPAEGLGGPYRFPIAAARPLVNRLAACLPMAEEAQPEPITTR